MLHCYKYCIIIYWFNLLVRALFAVLTCFFGFLWACWIRVCGTTTVLVAIKYEDLDCVVPYCMLNCYKYRIVIYGFNLLVCDSIEK